jgi:hypothetical protein
MEVTQKRELADFGDADFLRSHEAARRATNHPHVIDGHTGPLR